MVDLTTVTTIAQADTVTNAKEIVDFQQLVRMVPIGASVAQLRGGPGARDARQ